MKCSLQSRIVWRSIHRPQQLIINIVKVKSARKFYVLCSSGMEYITSGLPDGDYLLDDCII